MIRKLAFTYSSTQPKSLKDTLLSLLATTSAKRLTDRGWIAIAYKPEAGYFDFDPRLLITITFCFHCSSVHASELHQKGRLS